MDKAPLYSRGHGIRRAFLSRGFFYSSEGDVSMRFSKWKKFAAAAGARALLSGASFAQSGSTDESKRKVKTKI